LANVSDPSLPPEQRPRRYPALQILEYLQRPENRPYLTRFIRRKYARNSLISQPGARSGSVFIVLSGQLRVYLSYEGREFTLRLLNAGDIFSMHAKAIIEARQPSEILVASLEDFAEILMRIPQICLVVISNLGAIMSRSTQIIEDLVFRDVRGRLLHMLLELAAAKGSPTPEGIEIPFDIKTEDVAMMIVSTRQSTSSILNELMKEGYIQRSGKNSLLIRDLRKLHSLYHNPQAAGEY
jgi:CRP-like cAMP-binding protein